MKIFELLTRRADMTRVQATTYWTDVHAALVKKRMGDSGVVRRYINNVALDAQPASAAPFDGVVGAWLAIEPDRFAQQVSLPGNPVVADERNFLACQPLPMLVDETTLIAPSLGCDAKVLLFLRRGASIARDAFEAALADRVGAAARTAWGAALSGLVVNIARPACWGAWGQAWPLYDAAIELWIDSAEVDGLETFAASIGDLAQSPAWLRVREIVQIDLAPDGAGA